MKEFSLPLATFLFVAVSINGVAASESTSERRYVLAELSASRQNQHPGIELGAGDWASMIACTADLASDNPSLLDEVSCATAKDSDGGPCVWCDASSMIGNGVCVSASQKDLVGQFWDSICAAGSDTNPTPPDKTPVTPNPTPPPTPPPTDPAPAPVPDMFGCSMDESSNAITDKETCESRKDSSSDNGDNCVWCNVPIIGGSCIGKSMHSKVSFLCWGEDEAKTTTNLRGINDGVEQSWVMDLPSAVTERALT